jgi:hypothetical protein
MTILHPLASFPKAVVHIRHELVKMYPALGLNSAPLFVADVSLIEKLGQTKAGLFDVREPVCQRIEYGHHPLLSRIALNCSTCNESAIALGDGGEI